MNLRIAAAATASLVMLAAAGCSTTSPGYYGSAPPVSSSGVCYDCGTVTRIATVSRTGGAPNATGAVLGGIVGAAAAREIADRNTDSEGRKNSATVAGAVGGAIAGNAIQNRVQASGSYEVHVRMQDGRNVVVNQNELDGIREGSYVRVSNGRAWIR